MLLGAHGRAIKLSPSDECSAWTRARTAGYAASEDARHLVRTRNIRSQASGGIPVKGSYSGLAVRGLLLASLSALGPSGCSTPRPIEGVWRPGSGEDSESIPGPMKNFGPFDSFADALKAACPLILSKPNATVGYLEDSHPRLARQISTEYCAWLYYTPEHTYEMSMLTDQSNPDDLVTGKRSCRLPASVRDSRYTPDALKHIFALHNHPLGTLPSASDLRFSEEMAGLHGWVIDTKNTQVLLSIIAFSRVMLKWTQSQGAWGRELLGRVTWVDEATYRIDKQK